MSERCTSAPQPAAHNVFFAIRPPQDIRARIAEATASLPVGGRPLRPGRLHISTLNLVHEDIVPPGLGEEAAEAAASVRYEPFEVRFDRLVAGAKSMLLLPSNPLEELRMFRERLGFTLIRSGLPFTMERRFNPHITLLYGNALTFETAIEPIRWTVDDFVLIDSHIGKTKHVELGRWTLQS
ncbi:2'-5' RNA ligase family protein [Sphingomonas sp.]|uniref:2'-5' RNA ligase family protein n=1 Tax=Sphingomonas sp. TaxID=28214 RepID=UPI003B3A73A4